MSFGEECFVASSFQKIPYTVVMENNVSNVNKTLSFLKIFLANVNVWGFQGLSEVIIVPKMVFRSWDASTESLTKIRKKE